MNFAGNFLRIGTADVSLLKSVVEQLAPQHWTGETTRQNRYEAHRDTQAIGLAYDDDFRHENPTIQPPMQLFAPAIRELLAEIAAHYESQAAATNLLGQPGRGYFIRVNLVRMNPRGEITAHQDMNFSLAHSHRVHVPVLTNKDVFFSVGSETINMAEGHIIEINNRRIHSVRNASDEARVHLILDWVTPGESCCCSARTHPGEPCSPEACLESDRMRIPCHCFSEGSQAAAGES